MLRGKISCFVNKAAKTPNQAMNAEYFLTRASRTGGEPPDRFSFANPCGYPGAFTPDSGIALTAGSRSARQ